MTEWDLISDHIASATGQRCSIHSQQPIQGGCINAAYKVGDDQQHWFVKTNDVGKESMFAAEAHGLDEILLSKSLRAPRPICYGCTPQHSYLVLEYIPLQNASIKSSATLGEQLATMHQFQQNKFGWQRDNTIGSTPQRNSLDDNWITFWQHQRLGAQLALAKQRGAKQKLIDAGQALQASVHLFFTDYQPKPVLLHGDLWSGNYAADENDKPVIFDPAVYYGDRETDIAMTELFGGFNANFYSAYTRALPLDAGYQVRKNLYNLYHVLNHYNLFGSSYANQAEHLIAELLSHLR